MAQLKSGSTVGGQVIATQDWVTTNLIDAAPTALNTLNELAAALGDDPNFATTISTNLAGKASLNGSYGTDFYANAFYYDDWVRNHSNNNGIYWSTTGWHLYPESNLYFRVRSGNTGGAAIRFNTGGTDRNFIYVNNANEIGFLNTGGSWIFKVDNAGVLQTGTIPWARLSNVPATFAPSSHSHAISDVTGLQTALDGKQASGSYAASNHNHTYNVNDAWLRDNGDNANVKLYGNSRQMVFRTDGTTEYAAGVGGYAFAWMYGGDASGNRRMLLANDGRLWTSYHGWMDEAFDAKNSAATVNARIDEEIIPALGTIPTNTNQLTNGAGFLTSTNDRVYLTDSRGAQRAPSYYNDRYAQWDFQNASDTLAGGDSWHGVLTVSKWSVYDPSHRQEQIFFTGDNLKRRTATSDTTWGAVKTIWDSGNLNPIVSATVSNDTTTYTKADGSTFALTTSDANSDTYVTGASFNTGTGVLTLTRNSGSVTVDLDGRYESAGAAAAVNDRIDSEILTAINTNTTNIAKNTAALDTKLATTGKAADADKLDGYDWMQSGKSVRANEFYADGWLRNYNSGKGLYNEATTQHFYSDDDDYWNVAGGTGANGIRFRDEHNGTIRGYIYADNGNNVGILDAGGSWGIKHVNDNGTYFYTDNTTLEFRVGRDAVTGNYGTVQVDTTPSSWAGYSIQGNYVFMSSGTGGCGIYNDVDNEWMAYFNRNGSTDLHYNGSTKLSTNNGGVTVTGTVTATSFSGSGAGLTNLPIPDQSIPFTDATRGTNTTLASMTFDGRAMIFTMADGTSFAIDGARPNG